MKPYPAPRDDPHELPIPVEMTGRGKPKACFPPPIGNRDCDSHILHRNDDGLSISPEHAQAPEPASKRRQSIFATKSLQDPESAELRELHCNRCGAFLASILTNVPENDIWEIRVVCWECRTKELDGAR